MKRKADLIIVDTNIWLSFLISKTYSKLDGLLKSGEIRLAFSEELLAEFVEVSKRPKFKKYISKVDVDELLYSVK